VSEPVSFMTISFAFAHNVLLRLGLDLFEHRIGLGESALLDAARMNEKCPY
jgi:hypothetical protein